ncbi:ANTAR domain-containing protein [Methyloparacoccus murrellii]
MNLRIMLVDQHPGRSAIIEQALTDAGHTQIERVPAGRGLAEAVRRFGPDIIIVDMESPGRDTLEQMREIGRDRPKPIIMFSNNRDRDYIRQAVRAGVSAYVVDGLDKERVMPIVEVALARFREFEALRQELSDTKSQLADRKIIEKAKGILMRQHGISEDKAYAALRKAAMDRNQRIGDIARTLVSIHELEL